MTEPESTSRPRLSPLMVRILSGMTFVILFLVLLVSGLPGVIVLVAVLGGLALWEFRGLSEKMGHRSPTWLIFPLGALFAFYGTFLRTRLDLSLILSVALVGGLMVFLFIPGRREGLGRWAMGMAGAIYIGMPFNFYLLLYTSSGARGPAWVVFTVGAAVVSDIFALLGGMIFGRHPFFAAISPKKTVEGAITGIAGAILLFVIGGVLILQLSLAVSAGLGLLAGVCAMAGDLVESQMKRIAGVKDSSNLIPGHGGVLDRLDSLLFPPIVIYYVALWAGLLGGHAR